MNAEVIAKVKIHVQRIAELREAKAQAKLERQRYLHRLRTREWRARNIERVNAKRRAYYLAHREREIAYSRERRKTHGASDNAKRRAKYAQLSDEEKAKSIAKLNAWIEANPERAKATRAAWQRRKRFQQTNNQK